MQTLLLLFLLCACIEAAKRHQPSTQTTFSPATQPYIIEADRYYTLSQENYAKAKHAKSKRIQQADIARAQADKQIAEDILRQGSNNGSYGPE
jgi:hypothetical protein